MTEPRAIRIEPRDIASRACSPRLTNTAAEHRAHPTEPSRPGLLPLIPTVSPPVLSGGSTGIAWTVGGTRCQPADGFTTMVSGPAATPAPAASKERQLGTPSSDSGCRRGSSHVDTDAQKAGEEAERSAEQVGDSRPVRGLARGGLVAYGLVHLLISWIAVRIAWGTADKGSADSSGAMKALAAQHLYPCGSRVPR